MPMINLGRKFPSDECDAPSKEREPRIDFPSIFLREGDGVKLPDLPKGEFHALVTMRVAGFRDPADGERSVDLEVMNMSSPIAAAAALAMIPDDEEEEEESSQEKATSAFRSALKDAMGTPQIGQSA